jgi:hypothetical protein
MSIESQRMLFSVPSPWSQNDTEEFLNIEPLPAGFKWRLTKSTSRGDRGALVDVQPAHRDLSYGKWLRETPYFQGLFELVHQVVIDAGAELPSADEIAARLNTIRQEREESVAKHSIQ